MKTFNEHFVTKIYDLWEHTFGMEKIMLPSKVECAKAINCYRYKNTFVRLDTFLDNGTLIYCIEAAENKFFAENNIFDDAWLYPETMGIDKIIESMSQDLKSS